MVGIFEKFFGGNKEGKPRRPVSIEVPGSTMPDGYVPRDERDAHQIELQDKLTAARANKNQEVFLEAPANANALRTESKRAPEDFDIDVEVPPNLRDAEQLAKLDQLAEIRDRKAESRRPKRKPDAEEPKDTTAIV